MSRFNFKHKELHFRKKSLFNGKTSYAYRYGYSNHETKVRLCKKLSLFVSSLSIFLFSFLCPYQTFSEGANMYNYDYSPWSAYAPQIEKCSLGQFTLPDPAAITLLKIRQQTVRGISPEAQAKINSDIANSMLTVQIYGWTNNYCRVVYKSSRQEQNADNLGLGPLGFECHFTRDEVVALAGIARKLAANQIPLTGEDPASKIKDKACRALVENVPRPPESDANIPVYFIK